LTAEKLNCHKENITEVEKPRNQNTTAMKNILFLFMALSCGLLLAGCNGFNEDVYEIIPAPTGAIFEETEILADKNAPSGFSKVEGGSFKALAIKMNKKTGEEWVIMENGVSWKVLDREK